MSYYTKLKKMIETSNHVSGNLSKRSVHSESIKEEIEVFVGKISKIKLSEGILCYKGVKMYDFLSHDENSVLVGLIRIKLKEKQDTETKNILKELEE